MQRFCDHKGTSLRIKLRVMDCTKEKSVLWQPGGHSTPLGQLQPYDGGRSWTGRRDTRGKTMLLMSVQKGHRRKAEQWVCCFVVYFVMVGDVVCLNVNGRKPVQKR